MTTIARGADGHDRWVEFDADADGDVCLRVYSDAEYCEYLLRFDEHNAAGLSGELNEALAQALAVLQEGRK